MSCTGIKDMSEVWLDEKNQWAIVIPGRRLYRKNGLGYRDKSIARYLKDAIKFNQIQFLSREDDTVESI